MAKDKYDFTSVRVPALGKEFDGEQRDFIIELLRTEKQNYTKLITALTDVITESLCVLGDAEILGDLTVAGAIDAVGYITGKKSGAFVYALDQDTTIAVIDTWTTTTGTKTIPIIEDFSAAVTYTPGIKYDGVKDQIFKIDWAISYSLNKAAATTHFGVFKNGVLITGSNMETFGQNINQNYNLAGHAVISLTAGDELQLKVQSNKTGLMTLHHETTTISRFFN
jgi:hypothetical protein